MKKKLLLVTEDIVEIQTFSGKFGNLYSFLYQLLLKLKLKLAIFIFHRQFDITVLSTDQQVSSSATFLRYSEQFDPSKMDKYKPLAWALFRNIARIISQVDREFSQVNSIPLMTLWENKITSRLMNYYLNYLELLTRMVTSGQYSHVLILGSSIQEQIAKFICRQHQLKLLNFSFVNFNFLTKIFFHYFRQREIAKKLNNFKTQAQQPKLSIELLRHSVLLSVDFFRHLKTLIPVYQRLHELKAKPLFVVDELLISSYLNNSQAGKSNYIFLANFLSVAEIETKIIEWQPFANNIHRRVAKSLLREPKNIETLILHLVFPEISPIIKQGLILGKLYLLAGETLFQTLKPKSVVVAADCRLTELSLSYLAKIHQIPSFTVSPRTIMFEDEPYQYTQTDYIFVPGLRAKNQLIKLNVPAQKIIISGDPRYDYFDQLAKKFSSKNTLLKLGIRLTKEKIILLISERPNLYLPIKEKKEFFLLVSQIIKNKPDTILVIKPHPTEKKHRLLEELRQWGITNAIISNNQKVELFDLLKLSSVVIMVWSMTGLEAMMLKKPVIIVNPHRKNFDKFIPYIKNKAAVEANSLSDLSEYLDIYCNQQNPKTKKLISSGLKFSQQYILKPDGLATERVCQALAVNPPSTIIFDPVT